METKNRSIHELLIVMRDNFDKHFKNGLCITMCNLLDADLYSLDESSIVSDYLKSNLPYKVYNDAWCWPVGQPEPRKKWLEKQIKKTE